VLTAVASATPIVGRDTGPPHPAPSRHRLRHRSRRPRTAPHPAESSPQHLGRVLASAYRPWETMGHLVL